MLGAASFKEAVVTRRIGSLPLMAGTGPLSDLENLVESRGISS